MKTRGIPRNLFRSRARTGFPPPDGHPVSLSDREIARLVSAERKIGRCKLCGAPAAHAPVWVTTPQQSRRLGAPEGEARIIVVGLCSACRAMPDVFERIEEKLFAEAAAGLARPEAN